MSAWNVRDMWAIDSIIVFDLQSARFLLEICNVLSPPNRLLLIRILCSHLHINMWLC